MAGKYGYMYIAVLGKTLGLAAAIQYMQKKQQQKLNSTAHKNVHDYISTYFDSFLIHSVQNIDNKMYYKT